MSEWKQLLNNCFLICFLLVSAEIKVWTLELENPIILNLIYNRKNAMFYSFLVLIINAFLEYMDFYTEGSLSNTLNEKNNFPRAHNTRGRHSSLTMDTVREMTILQFQF